jgi:hypothetical protein
MSRNFCCVALPRTSSHSHINVTLRLAAHLVGKVQYSLAPRPPRNKSLARISHCPSSRRLVPAFSVPVTFLASFSHSNMTGMSLSPSPSTSFSNVSTITGHHRQFNRHHTMYLLLRSSILRDIHHHSQCVLDPSPNSRL